MGMQSVAWHGRGGEGRTLAGTAKRAGIAAMLMLAAGLAGTAQSFNVTNILSDGSVPATTTDPNFINPWGISVSPTWWISAAGSGFNYVVPATGAIAFKVIVPLGAKPTTNGVPSGSVTTAGSTGFVLPNGTAPNFLFSTLDGTIAGWNGKLGTNNAVAQIVINNSASGASYTGLALLNTTNGSFLLAPNFSSAAVEVYDSTYKPAKLAGSFTDPNLPTNYAPYSIHILGTQVFVTYTQRTASAPYQESLAPGAALVDVYDTSGNLTARAITGGNLNAPWGVAYAPANFGIYSNDLLVGNFGDGKINAYDQKTYAYVGQLMNATGKSLASPSLWDLLSGGTKVTNSTAVSGGDTSTVYFSAGLTGEAHGLFGAIGNGTVAGSTPTFGFTSGSSTLTAAVGSAIGTPLSAAPANGFSGTVTLSCSGLPAGATCTFSPTTLTVSPTAAALGSVTIVTTTGTAGLAAPVLPGRFGSGLHSGLAIAALLPFGVLFGFRRRLRGRPFAAATLLGSTLLGFRLLGFRLLGCGVALLAACTFVAGCADSPAPIAATPTGQSNVVVTATSGSITQQTTIALTVK